MRETQNPSVWSFTTLADQTVNTFPWSEGFEGDIFPPLGWKSEKEGYTVWDRSNYNAYHGKNAAYISARSSNEQGILQTPMFVLPADKDMQVSFYWGNAVPSGLTKSVKETMTINKDTLYFEIKSDET